MLHLTSHIAYPISHMCNHQSKSFYSKFNENCKQQKVELTVRLHNRQNALGCPKSPKSATQSIRIPWRAHKHRQNAPFSERARRPRIGGFGFMSHTCLYTRSLLYRTRGLACWTQFSFAPEAFAVYREPGLLQPAGPFICEEVY